MREGNIRSRYLEGQPLRPLRGGGYEAVSPADDRPHSPSLQDHSPILKVLLFSVFPFFFSFFSLIVSFGLFEVPCFI